MENIALLLVKPKGEGRGPRSPPPPPASADLTKKDFAFNTIASSAVASSAVKKASVILQPINMNNVNTATGQITPRQNSPVPQLIPGIGVKFVSAGIAACIADGLTFPLDTAKVRLQLQGGGTAAAAVVSKGARSGGALTLAAQQSSAVVQKLKYRGLAGTIATISKEEGVRALYNGLVPGLQRQLCFASIRIGLYDSVKHGYIKLFRAEGQVHNEPIGLRILAGITTGGMAIVFAQPTDVVKVRFQARPYASQYYGGVWNAYKFIGKREGFKGLWKGSQANIARNGIVNATELVSYDLIKESLIRRQLLSDSMPCHFTSAFGAGFFATLVASPVDVVKTRLMSASPGVYRGAIHVATKMYKETGAKSFYKGFIPSFMRLGSWNVVMFVCYEQLKRHICLIQKAAAEVPISTTFPTPISLATHKTIPH